MPSVATDVTKVTRGFTVVGRWINCRAIFDEDGDIDGGDLAQWKGDFGFNGDSDADGESDGSDFLAWQRQLGSDSSVAVTAAVPEPTTLFIIALLAAVGIRFFSPEASKESHELDGV